MHSSLIPCVFVQIVEHLHVLTMATLPATLRHKKHRPRHIQHIHNRHRQSYQPPLQNTQPPPAYARATEKVVAGDTESRCDPPDSPGPARRGWFLCLSLCNQQRRQHSSATGANSEVTPTQAPLKTTPINATVTYASVTITIINAQQATSFADDTNTPAQGVVRLNLHAVQSDVNNVDFTSAPAFAYPESFALLLPGGSKVALGGYKDLNGPARKGDQMTWIDFPASTSLKVNQMILQIGKDTEEQIQVPLTGHADLSQYQPKQSTPDLRVQFGSVFWTLKTVTFKLSDSGTQVDKGMRFLVLAFSLDNPGTEADNSYPA